MKEKKVRHFWWELELIDIIQEYYKSDDYDPTRLILFVARIIEEVKQQLKDCQDENIDLKQKIKDAIKILE